MEVKTLCNAQALLTEAPEALSEADAAAAVAPLVALVRSGHSLPQRGAAATALQVAVEVSLSSLCS